MNMASQMRALPGGFVLMLVLVGCGAQSDWDREYACSGQEQSSTSYEGDPAGASFRKQYPITIDFHIRSDSALVKSHQARVEKLNSGAMNLTFAGPSSSISGRFEPKDNALQLVETRYSVVDGRKHEVHTAGQYLCKTELVL